MKTIPLTQNKHAIVSDCDYKWLSRWKWYYAKCSVANDGYAVRHGPRNKTILMHKEIARRMQLPHGEADHRNQNKLDNRRSNLRRATPSQNKANCGVRTDNTSGIKGVSWHGLTRSWQVRLGICGRVIYLGCHKNKMKAARLYNHAAKKHFGAFAWLNRIEERRKMTTQITVERRYGRERRASWHGQVTST